MTVKFSRDRGHIRYRLKDGSIVPGASTIGKIGDGADALIHWAWQCGMEDKDYRKVRDNAADIGTIAHFLIECHIKGHEPDTSELSPADVSKAENSFLKSLEWWDASGLKPIGDSEVQLVSERHRYGGTIDLPCIDGDGKRVIVDWKTSNAIYDSHQSQLAGYWALWNENRPSEQADRCIIVRIGKSEANDLEVREVHNPDMWFDVFKAQLGLYWARRAMKGAS